MVDAFLLGVIATSSLFAGLFFLKFWRKTRDGLFLAFAAAFIIEGLNRSATIFFDNPGEAGPWRYVIRLFSLLLVLGAILHKNRGQR